MDRHSWNLKWLQIMKFWLLHPNRAELGRDGRCGWIPNSLRNSKKRCSFFTLTVFKAFWCPWRPACDSTHTNRLATNHHEFISDRASTDLQHRLQIYLFIGAGQDVHMWMFTGRIHNNSQQLSISLLYKGVLSFTVFLFAHMLQIWQIS